MDGAPHSWPDLVGKNGEEAVEIIKKDGYTSVHIIKAGSMVTMDYRTDRVRVHVDQNGKVQYPPTIG